MNSSEIKGSQLRPEPFIKPHHFRHPISGSIVFLMGIAADLVIMEYRHYSPKTVRWQNGETQTGVRLTRQSLPTPANQVEIGLSDDGILIWRPKK